MNQIKLDCFTTDNTCQLISLDRAINVNDPLAKEVFLEIINHSSNRCLVKMMAQSSANNEHLAVFNLIISKEKEILFNNSFAQFFKTEIDLGEILADSSATYVLQMDLLNLVLAQNKLLLGFNLIFSFTCEDLTDQIEQKEEDSTLASKQQSVLSATSQSEIISSPQEPFSSPIYLFLLLSTLFVIIFFVIMKFIHGQKKKKQTKTRI